MPQHIDAALLSEARILAAYLIFFGSYFVFALGKLPWMKIDRPGAAIIGAVLMVAFRIVGADEALRSIDFATIVLLFAMMVVVANLRLGGFFERLAESIVQRLHPRHLLRSHPDDYRFNRQHHRRRARRGRGCADWVRRVPPHRSAGHRRDTGMGRRLVVDDGLTPIISNDVRQRTR